MTNVSSAIRKFNRFELKYLLPMSKAERFKEAIKPYLLADRYGDEQGNYAVTSLYHDSPDHHFYWEKIEGIKFRRKLRIRIYESAEPLTPDSQVFVEIKQRLNRITQKRRVVLTYRDALKLCNQRTMIDEYEPKDRLVLEEIQTMTWQYNLRPTSIVSYFRQAFTGTDYDVGLRVTFDTNLRYRVQDLQLHSKKIGRFMFPPETVVMEIKANERVPYWLTELAGEQGIGLIRVSKYCQSLEAADLVPRTKYTS